MSCAACSNLAVAYSLSRDHAATLAEAHRPAHLEQLISWGSIFLDCPLTLNHCVGACSWER